MTAGRLAGWLGTTAIVVLAGRSLAYALEPSPSQVALELEGQAGGPRLVTTALVVLALALGVSAALLWLVSLGVRERHELSGAPGSAPRVRPASVALSALGLFAGAAAAFTLLESYLQWRLGLGYHGLHCLVGPAHRDAVPILAGLALTGAAVRAAVDLLLGWIGRTVALLARREPAAPRGPEAALAFPAVSPRIFGAPRFERTRGPPAGGVPALRAA